MSVRELHDGTDFVRNKVYSWNALSKRLLIKPIWMKPLTCLSYLGFRFYQRRIAKVGQENPIL